MVPSVEIGHQEGCRLGQGLAFSVGNTALRCQVGCWTYGYGLWGDELLESIDVGFST